MCYKNNFPLTPWSNKIDITKMQKEVSI
jgi:hypothetical protein